MHPKQIEIDANPARFKIIRAGRKFGKTTYAQRKALDWLGKPNSTVWFIAPYLKQARLISWSEFKRLIPIDALAKKPNDVDLTITLRNGSQLLLMGSDDPDTLRGPAPHGVIFDEAAFHRREAWFESVMPNLMPTKGPAIFISTPKGYNWFHDLEQEALKLIKQGDKEWAVFHFSVWDNPHIDTREIERQKTMCDTEANWRQEYMAEYEASEGRVFAAFADDRHCKKVEVPRGSFDCYRSIDWGMRDNTACLWAFIRGGRLFVYREYLGNNLSAPAQAKIIKGHSLPSERCLRTAISHDSKKEDPAMKGLTVFWHFNQAGIEGLIPSSRKKEHSRQMINQLLQENRLVIDPDKCLKLRKQMLSYEWKDTDDEKPEVSGEDDAVDALHYLVELLQFDLFIAKPKGEPQTQAEMMAEIAREKLEMSTRLRVPSVFRPDTGFGSQFEDTFAGYI